MVAKSILRDFFDELPDPRVERTRKHLLSDILLIVLAGMLTGCRGWDAIHEFVKMGPPELLRLLRLPNGVPSSDTLRRTISKLDAGAFAEAFTEFSQSLAVGSEGRVIAVDGKTVRGANRQEGIGGSLHLVNAWLESNGMTLGQVATDDKSNEIVAIPKLLDLLAIEGATVTIDAMGCQKKIAATICSKGADYLFGLKKNQPTLHQEVVDAFTAEKLRELSADPNTFYESVDKGHGRFEVRKTWVMKGLPWLTEADNWTNLRSAVLVESTRTVGTETTKTRRTYITSLEPTAECAGHIIRRHWGVESMHWILDVVFGEDSARMDRKNGAENMSLVRKLSTNLLKRTPPPGYDKLSLVGRSRHAHRDVGYLVSVLTGPTSGN